MQPHKDESNRISGMVHDLWFDVDAIANFPNKDSLEIPLALKSNGLASKLLTICNVFDITVEDTERIGWYPIRYITIDQWWQTATIIGSIPVRVVVSSLTSLSFDVRDVKHPDAKSGKP